jgi:hypothetical protein
MIVTQIASISKSATVETERIPVKLNMLSPKFLEPLNNDKVETAAVPENDAFDFTLKSK